MSDRQEPTKPERARVDAIVAELLAGSEAAGAITLDAIGEAIGVRAITPEEIDAIMTALERNGRRIETPKGGEGEARLRAVVTTLRALGPELGRKPTLLEIAERSGLTVLEVRHALALVRIMQR